MKWWYLFVLSFMLIPVTTAGSIGISPTNFEFFFEPGLEKTFSFSVVDSDSENEIEAYVDGSLAEYATISQSDFVGSGSFEVNIKLPNEIERPGLHKLYVGVRQKASGDGGVVKGLAAVQAVIEIYVPFPGKYAETDFKIEDINEGENSSYSLIIHNLGTEDATFNSAIEIFGENQSVLKLDLPETFLESKESTNFSGKLDTSSFPPGFYDVETRIEFGESLLLENVLRVGNYFVNISNYTYRFETGKINKFEIGVENLWNSEIEGVFFEVTLSEEGVVFSDFRSASVDLAPWEKATLKGFVDATNTTEGKYVMNIKISYPEGSNSKLAYGYFFDPEKDYTLFWIIGSISLLAIMLLLALTIISFKMRKLIKSKKIEKKNGKDKK